MSEIMVGQVLKSYCNGYFGRDFYGGRVEAVGYDWIVARDEFGVVFMAYMKGGLAKHAHLISGWNEYEQEASEAGSE